MANIDTVKSLLSAMFSSQLGGNKLAETEIAKLFTEVYDIEKSAADATNSTTTAATALVPPGIRGNGQVTAVYLTSTAAITADATNNATLTVKAYPAGGVTGLTVATLVTTTAITAFQRTAFTLATTASQLAVAEGGSFSLEIAKGGTGITLPICGVQIFVEPKG